MELLQNSDFSWHTEQPDVPQKSAAQMKAFFDAPTHTLMQKTNEVIGRINTLLADENTQGSVAYDIRKAIGMVTDFSGIVAFLEQNGGEAADLLEAVSELQALVGESSVADQIAASRADYVTETGEDGVWSYRKWASGEYDAWCKYEVESVSTTELVGGIYVYSAEQQAPSFSKSITTCLSDNSMSGTISWGASNFGGNYIWYRTFASTAASGVTLRVCLRISGKWK